MRIALVCIGALVVALAAVLLWRALATQQAIRVLAAQTSDHSAFETALGPLPPVATATGISTFMSLEQLKLNAVEKLEHFLATQDFACDPDVGLVVREGDVERRYFQFSTARMNGRCAMIADQTIEIDSDAYVDRLARRQRAVLKEKHFLGWSFQFAYVAWDNRLGELVRLEANVYRAPTFFWERFSREISGALAPYWLIIPVYAENLPLGIMTRANDGT